MSQTPSFEAEAALAFFETAGRNILAAERAAGVKHHVALSMVGTERLLSCWNSSGYFRAKMAQEKLIKTSPIPYTIVRSTQFFELVGSVVQSSTENEIVRVPDIQMQPIVSDDVAAAIADVATAAPLNGIVEIAGPERIRLNDLVHQFLAAHRDSRTVVIDRGAGYYGTAVNDQSQKIKRDDRFIFTTSVVAAPAFLTFFTFSACTFFLLLCYDFPTLHPLCI